jgi:hypothetical protein
LVARILQEGAPIATGPSRRLELARLIYRCDRARPTIRRNSA